MPDGRQVSVCETSAGNMAHIRCQELKCQILKYQGPKYQIQKYQIQKYQIQKYQILKDQILKDQILRCQSLKWKLLNSLNPKSHGSGCVACVEEAVSFGLAGSLEVFVIEHLADRAVV